MKKSPWTRTVLLSTMALCAIYPWNVLFYSFVPSPPPGFDTMAVYMAAACLVFIVSGRYFSRKLYRRVFQVVTYVASVIFISYESLRSGNEETFAFILFCLFTLYLWISAARYTGNWIKTVQSKHEFDRGLTLFALLLLVKILLIVKQAEYEMPGVYFFPLFIMYILLGFTVIARGQHQPVNRRSQEPHRPRVLLVLLFFIVVLAPALFFYQFFFPEMRWAAETGTALMGTVLEPLGKAFLFFFMSLNFGGVANAHSAKDGGAAPGVPETGSLGPVSESLAQIILVAGVLVAAVFTLLLLYYMARKLIRWLLSSRKIDRQGGGIRLLLHDLRNLCTWFTGRPKALRYYRHLVRWGRLTGTAYKASFTSFDVSAILKRRFPSVSQHIDTVVAFHDDYLYGEKQASAEEIRDARGALRRILQPGVLLKKFGPGQLSE